MKKYTMNNPIAMRRDADITTMRKNLESYLAEEKRKHVKRAYNSGHKSCQGCGFCCLTQSCVPTPKEFNIVAEYLNLTPQELASQYAVVNVDTDGFYLLWARETQKDILGEILPIYRTYDRGYCTFFDKVTHGCKIHDVRPYSAYQTRCWEKEKEEFDGSWTIEQIFDVLPDFNPDIGKLCVIDESGNICML